MGFMCLHLGCCLLSFAGGGPRAGPGDGRLRRPSRCGGVVSGSCGRGRVGGCASVGIAVAEVPSSVMLVGCHGPLTSGAVVGVDRAWLVFRTAWVVRRCAAVLLRRSLVLVRGSLVVAVRASLTPGSDRRCGGTGP
jgi:hypothetical protein